MAKKLKVYNGSSWEDVTFAITPPSTDVTNAFTTNQVIDASTSVAALRVTQRGTGEAFRVEDSTNPDASPFVITSSGNVGIGLVPDAIASSLTTSGSIQIGKNATASNNWHIATESGDGDIRFWNGNYGAGSEKFRVTSGGGLLTSGALAQIPATYTISFDAGVSGWIKLGTWTAPQYGHTLHIKYINHDGYNADHVQNQEVDIYFKTSNGVSASVDANGFAADGHFYTTGRAGRGVTAIKAVSNAAGGLATAYDIYVYNGAYWSSSTYTVFIGSSTRWSHFGQAASDPGVASSTVASLYNITGNVGALSYQSTSYQLALSDCGRVVDMQGGGSLVIPTQATVPFPLGTQITVLQTSGSQVTISGASGVTIRSTGATSTAPKLRTNNSAATLIQRYPNDWIVIGDIV
jgi:hypothetical protein